jgi:hypothetical protein
VSYESEKRLRPRAISEGEAAIDAVPLATALPNNTFQAPSGDFVIPNEMQNYQLNLGELRSVIRPSTARIWIMVVISLGLLMAVMFGAVLTLNSFTSLFTQNKPGTAVSGPVVCLSVSSLCLAIFSSFLIGDFRKWSASRTIQLRIYQEGFTYEEKGQIEAYRWDEIKDINFRVIEIHSKHSAPAKVRVIRSIVKRDGTVIDLAETLDLIKITKLITNATKKLG